MIIYHGVLQRGDHDGAFVLMVPEGLSDGQAFTAYWMLAGVPNFYRGTFDDASSSADIPAGTLLHRGENCEFSFISREDGGGESECFDSIDIEFSWYNKRGIVASLYLTGDNIVNDGSDRNAAVYAGILSGHPQTDGRLLVLSIFQDSAVGETAQVLLFSPVSAHVERERLFIERFEGSEAGIVAFAASSSRWTLEADRRDFEKESKFTISLKSTESGVTGSATVELVSPSIPTGAITVTLINDSGQTLQYWTARSDPHLAEDLVSLGLDTLSFVAPNWSPTKALQTFANGVKVFQKIKKKISILSGAGDLAKSSIDLLQRKTGKVNSTDFLEPNQRITFWDFDGTITGGMDMSLTWFRLDYEENKKTALLHFDTATTTFNKLKSYSEIRASELFEVPKDFKTGEKLKRQGSRLRSTLPEGWTAKSKTISLTTPLVRCNFHGQKISNLTLTCGQVPDCSTADSLPAWSDGVLYNPITTKVYKKTFDIYCSDVRTDAAVGYLDNSHLLYVEGDVDEYKPLDYHLYTTKGTFIRHYFYQPPSSSNISKMRATAWSHKVVFLEYAFIQPDPTGTYKNLQVVEFPREVGDPKIATGLQAPPPRSRWYEPFLDAVREGLCSGDNWKKRYWAYWFDPDKDRVYGAVYKSRRVNEKAGVSPWIIRRRYPPTHENLRPADWPVVAFVCQGDMPINFNDCSVADEEVNASKYDT
ncbi:predicted protein [Uncinocarpus reesii 1704]|uniref:Uncharacterized protein n=1 Tax=Uncinocarpus reesii (strain UAMH 1704) TaxID=336963 RepID=C4JN75_UNCRE|nr:uncharacterized protein UREG_04283 [Uncinocarpus reesii 1704]EEP79437.1 predicted protein [Uncinocarpus reesii 1704]